MDDKSLKCIFLAYVPGCKTYKVYDTVGNQIYPTRDVIFAKNTQDLDSSQIQFVAENDVSAPKVPLVPILEPPAPTSSYTLGSSSAPTASTSTSDASISMSPISIDDIQVEATNFQPPPKWVQQLLKDAAAPPSTPK